MSKAKTVHACTECGYISTKWQGKCPGCDSWNTLVESISETGPATKNTAGWTGQSKGAALIGSISTVDYPRFSSGLDEFDRVLGGGFVRGSVTLLGGEPGIGKSTLLLQAAREISKAEKVLYITGEESTNQVAMRGARLGATNSPIHLASEISIEKIQALIDKEQATWVVLDSIQTTFSEALQSAPGSVAQVRECGAILTRLAKTKDVTIVLVGHVTKEGTLAGPRVLEHMVDTVLYFEAESSSAFRMLRGFKNRYGPVNELGVFNMTGDGLEPVLNPSSLFITAHEKPVQGSCLLAAYEGNRPFLIEAQALVEDTASPNPRRFGSGVDVSRLQMLLAVLNKFAGVAAFDKNVYVKIVGGIKLTEPAADLGVLLAVYSSLRGVPLPLGFAACGEVGLTGEIRAVAQIEDRLREAQRLGCTTVLVPNANYEKAKRVKDLKVVSISRLDQAFSIIRELKDAA